MFKQLTLNKELFVCYLTYVQEYHFTLEGEKADGTPIEYLIHYKQNKLFSVKENIYYTCEIDEKHELIQAFSETDGFKEAMNYIEKFEQQMKDSLKIKNMFLEGKLDDQTYVLSFQLISPVLNKKRIKLRPEANNEDCFHPIVPSIFLYMVVKRNGKTFVAINDIKVKALLSYHNSVRPPFDTTSFNRLGSLNPHYYTHHAFVEDIKNMLTTDPRIRIKLLVN